MDYEKLHKDTIAKLQEMVNSGKITVKTACGICADFVLESEDERIRKEMIEILRKEAQDFPSSVIAEKSNSWIAWLEKQGKNSMGISEATKQKLEDNLNKALEKETPESCNEFLEKQGEQKPAETVKWSPQEESCICQLESLVKEQWRQADKIHNSVNIKKMSELMFFLKTLNPKKKPQRIISAEAKEAMYDKPAWSEEDEKIYQSIMDDTVQENQLDDKQTDWLKNLKDRVLPQQTEWSEDDKGNLLDVKCVIDEVWHNQYVRETIDYSCEELESLWHWLDNIWQRVEFPHDTWKPSDEQMEVLLSEVTAWAKGCPKQIILESLYNDLRKLKG